MGLSALTTPPRTLHHLSAAFDTVDRVPSSTHTS